MFQTLSEYESVGRAGGGGVPSDKSAKHIAPNDPSMATETMPKRRGYVAGGASKSTRVSTAGASENKRDGTARRLEDAIRRRNARRIMSGIAAYGALNFSISALNNIFVTYYLLIFKKVSHARSASPEILLAHFKTSARSSRLRRRPVGIPRVERR